MRRLLRWLWIGTATLVAVVMVLILFVRNIPIRSETLRQRIVSTMAWRLNRDVMLDQLSLRIFPRLHAEGTGLVIRQRGRRDVPPLISIKKFTVDTDLLRLVRKHVAHVVLSGLDISVPPDNNDQGEALNRRPEVGSRAARPSRRPPTDLESLHDGVILDTLDSTDAQLIIVPRNPGKAPKTWAIHTLRMHSVGITQSMPFEATLANAVPPGEIETAGNFGPWDRDEPGDTPLEGTFTFAKADLGVFHGISGTLSAHGSFGGSLGRIDVNGETDTPDFTIKVSGHPFPLHAKYHTIVDGTNGDTRLERIDAQFLQSTLVAHGSVLDAPPGRHGRTVTLDLTMPKARLDDVMTMAVKTPKPPMTGGLQLTTKFLLPPGETDVVDRLKLDGRFEITRAHFTNYDVQAKVDALSHRSRGRSADDQPDDVISNFKGRFLLGNGRLRLPELMFEIPGAQVTLAGVYAIKAETLDFRGTLLMAARVSETQKGFKSLLLKIVDPLFKGPGGGSAIPIKIRGPRNDPQFGLDVGRVFKRGDDF